MQTFNDLLAAPHEADLETGAAIRRETRPARETAYRPGPFLPLTPPGIFRDSRQAALLIYAKH